MIFINDFRIAEQSLGYLNKSNLALKLGMAIFICHSSSEFDKHCWATHDVSMCLIKYLQCQNLTAFSYQWIMFSKAHELMNKTKQKLESQEPETLTWAQ